MRKILYIIFILMVSSGYAQNKKTSWDWDGLKDKVKVLKTKNYNAIDTLERIVKGQLIDDVYGSILIKYNQSGAWTEYRSFNPDGSVRWAELPVFDEKGNMIDRGDYIYSGADSTLYRRYRMWYDNTGNMTEMIRSDSTGSVISKSCYKYDNKNNNTETQSFNSSGTLEWKINSEYDGQNNMIQNLKSDISGSLVEKTVYKYNDRGNMIEYYVYKGDEKPESKIVYQYNNKNFCTEICQYDKQGNLKKTTFKYIFDSKDNWIEKIEFRDGIVTKITERQIEYF